jgi:hypothetical protein
MQGLQALDQFKNFVSKIGGLGRYEDTYIVHAAEGETVIPMEVLDQNPILKKRLFKTMVDMGIEPGRYIVGNDLNSKNPVTGQPEFFFKKIIDRVKKAAADVSGYAAPIVGAMYGPAAGALTGGVLGSFKRENPGDPTQGLNMALRGGLAGLASNVAGGQNTFFGKGLSGDSWMKPTDIFSKYVTGDSARDNWANYFKDKDGKSNIRNWLEGFSEGNITSEDAGALAEIEESNLSPEMKKAVEKAWKDKKSGKFGDLSFKKILQTVLGITVGGEFLKSKQSNQDVGERHIYDEHGLSYDKMLAPYLEYSQNLPIVQPMAQGGVMDLQEGGESTGPGTGTSDSIPAMLSDGEFVMTAKAVRGAGGGDRREGAKQMYQLMQNLEDGGQLSRLSRGMEARA